MNIELNEPKPLRSILQIQPIIKFMAPRKKNETPDTESSVAVNFETALAELESITTELERDDIELDAALLHFERGIKLMRICDTHLNHVRGKITELFKGEDGSFVEKILGTSLKSFLDKESGND